MDLSVAIQHNNRTIALEMRQRGIFRKRFEVRDLLNSKLLKVAATEDEARVFIGNLILEFDQQG